MKRPRGATRRHVRNSKRHSVFGKRQQHGQASGFNRKNFQKCHGLTCLTLGGPWTCLEITATALNQVQRPSTVLDACLWRTVLQPSSQLSSSHARSQGRRKKPEAADIFGFLFDAEGFACVSTALDPTTKGSPIATLTMPFPQGQKTPIKFVAAVQSRSPRPFRFAAFKGNYRSASVAKTFQTFDPCEIDSSKCDDPLDQPDNAKALLNGKGFEYNKG